MTAGADDPAAGPEDLAGPEEQAGPEELAELAELAAAYGVATGYHDWQGQPVRVAPATLRAVLAALGVAAGTPGAVRAALRNQRLDRWRQLLPPCVVVRVGVGGWVPVHVPHGDPVEVWVELEGGGERRPTLQQAVWVEPVDVDGVLTGEATFALPPDLPLGWHVLHARVGAPGDPAGPAAAVPLVVTPDRLDLPAGLAERRVWGLMTQLYAVRSRRSWGLGDLADLADLAGWSGPALGAGFVLVNPLHAAGPAAPMEPSPYLPASRRFTNPIYLRVEQVPEAVDLPAADRDRLAALADALRRTNGLDTPLDRDAVWAAKRAALALVHRVPRSPTRQAAYDRFRAAEGSGLVDFATWCALVERHGPPAGWPPGLRDPGSPEVAAAREGLADTVDFHCWLQWLCDEQLAAAQRAARAAGLPVGIMHDLAVGVHREGADAWALRGVLARGVHVGAPPDAFNQQGQDWSQPPWHPRRLAAAGYAPYRDMLRGVLRHAGGVRVDHVLGLFRLWWVPEGAPPGAGTYVRYDHDALVGILALEAHRAGAVVVGEDLGTVEPWVRDYLRDRGIAGTSVLWFERDETGAPRPPEQWRELCLATVATHDLPPTAGYLAGEHVALRSRLGLLVRSVAEEAAADEADRRSWLDLLVAMGLLRPGPVDPDSARDVEEVVVALHRFLARTPARLLGVSLADAVGDRRAVNQPGTTDEYPNWRLPLAGPDGAPVLLEDLREDPATARRVRRLVAAVSDGVAPASSRGAGGTVRFRP